MTNFNRRQVCQIISTLGYFSTLLSMQALAEGQLRIVCVGGAITEIIFELGLDKYLVGVDSSSNFPPSVKILPNVGYARMLSAEGILSLKPTHILFSDNAGPQHVVDLLRVNKNSSFKHYQQNPSFDGLIETIKKIANLLGVIQKGQLVTQRLYSEWGGLSTEAETHIKQAPKVLFILSHRSSEILVGGIDTEADVMIRYAGGINVASSLKGYKSFNKEVLIQMNPDIILMTDQSKKHLLSTLMSQSTNKVSAIRKNRVIAMDANQLLGFGPRLPMTIKQLRKEFLA